MRNKLSGEGDVEAAASFPHGSAGAYFSNARLSLAVRVFVPLFLEPLRKILPFEKG